MYEAIACHTMAVVKNVAPLKLAFQHEDIIAEDNIIKGMYLPANCCIIFPCLGTTTCASSVTGIDVSGSKSILVYIDSIFFYTNTNNKTSDIFDT
jgi:hypothetical protein